MNDPLRNGLKTLAPFVVFALTVGVLVLSLQTDPATWLADRYALQLVLAGALTLFSIYFGVLLTDGELSASHVVGITLFLAFPVAAFPAFTLAIAVGALAGGVSLRLRGRIHPLTHNRIASPASLILLVGRVTLSFWSAGMVYLHLLGGQLPLNTREAPAPAFINLALYALVYILVYLLIYLLECVYTSTRISVKDFWRILIVIILPAPFAILAAEVLYSLGEPAQIIFMAGLMFIVFSLHALSLSEFQVRKQLGEVQTLSIMTQTLRSHLELSALLRTIYVQVAHLLEIENFTAALYDPETNRLTLALVMRHGHEEARQAGLPVDESSTLTGYVYTRGEALLISGDVIQRAAELGVTVTDATVSTWLGVPLQTGGKVSGVLAVHAHNPDQHFTQNDRRLLTIVAASSSIAIENAQLYKQQTERTEQLSTLNRITGLLSESLSTDDTFSTIITSASILSKAHAVALYVVDDNAGFRLAHSGGMSDAFIASPPQPLITRIGISEAQRPRTTITIENAVHHTQYAHTGVLSVLESEGKAAYLELPVAIGHEMLGALTLYYNTPQTFSGESIELLRTFTNQAAQAILNARQYTQTSAAYQKTSTRLDILLEIGRSLASTVELRRLYDLILSQALSATKAERGILALSGEPDNRLAIAASEGFSADLIAQVDPNKLPAQCEVLQTGSILYLPDLTLTGDNGRHQMIHPHTASALIVPIKRGETVRGTVTLECDRQNGFSRDDLHFVEQLANQAAIAIDNSRLFNRISRDRDRLQVLLDAMEEGIMLVDEAGVIVLANPRLDLIGLSAPDLINQNLVTLIESSAEALVNTGFEDAEEIRALVAHMDRVQAYSPAMYSVRGAKGELFIRRQILPIRNEQGRVAGLLLVFYNKTEEEELARSRDEFSRMIVHDLRSPLTAVTTSLKFLTEFIPPDSEYYRLVQTMTDTSRRAIKKLLRRVDSLLDIAKIESGQIELEKDLTDLRGVVENVFSELEPLTQELEIELVSEIPHDFPPLYIDTDKIERVIMNLVDNATKYNPQQSSIIIRAHLQGSSRDSIAFAQIDVIDHGPGVPDEYKERLFDRFVQIEGRQKVRRGVGLGLAFCRMVVVAHGGRIWIEDNPAGGSVFSFTLPMANLQPHDD